MSGDNKSATSAAPAVSDAATAVPSTSASPATELDSMVRDPLWFMTGSNWYRANPCFRVSLLYGIASGFGFMMHTQYRYREWPRSNMAFLKAFSVVSLCSWQYCRWSMRRDRRQAMDAMNRNTDFLATQQQEMSAAARAHTRALDAAGIAPLDAKATTTAPAAGAPVSVDKK